MKALMKLIPVLLVAGLVLAMIPGAAEAQGQQPPPPTHPPDPYWNDNNNTVNSGLSGSNNTTGNNTSGTGTSSSNNTSTGSGGGSSSNRCRRGVAAPGARVWTYQYINTRSNGVKYCSRSTYQADECGNRLWWMGTLFTVPCPSAQNQDHEEEQVTNPCSITASMSADGLSASCSDQWKCAVKVPLPPSYIDVRPYPATLVRWPTALRFSGQGTSKNVCTVADAGSMRNLTMELEFRPATGIVTITLPYLPVFTLRVPQMVNFKWEVPSHPAVGADRLAGELGGFFDEIPADFPAFSGTMKTPYDLFWKITFEKQNRNGEWVGHSFDGKLLPQDVRDTPPGYFADLNGDGKADAWWDPNFVISRMDENNRTDNPAYERHWSYGELLPWAVREGQGQVGWPGVP